ncbi:MAG: hypothetical protein IT384_06620 [Deltaproteobacteria bacterium]|nr:hypothetical protein [Deltaproteobacteria bacterium]
MAKRPRDEGRLSRKPPAEAGEDIATTDSAGRRALARGTVVARVDVVSMRRAAAKPDPRLAFPPSVSRRKLLAAAEALAANSGPRYAEIDGFTLLRQSGETPREVVARAVRLRKAEERDARWALRRFTVLARRHELPVETTLGAGAAPGETRSELAQQIMRRAMATGRPQAAFFGRELLFAAPPRAEERWETANEILARADAWTAQEEANTERRQARRAAKLSLALADLVPPAGIRWKLDLASPGGTEPEILAALSRAAVSFPIGTLINGVPIWASRGEPLARVEERFREHQQRYESRRPSEAP